MCCFGLCRLRGARNADGTPLAFGVFVQMGEEPLRRIVGKRELRDVLAMYVAGRDLIYFLYILREVGFAFSYVCHG